MTLWITALYVLSNFTLGAMLPLLPALSPDGAGVSFTAFNVMKVLFFVPAGLVSDRIGHSRALTATLALQVVALVLVGVMPERPFIGRTLEGLALAQGTVTLVSLLRIVSPDEKSFAVTIRRVLGIGSMGFLLGPAVGYPIAARRPEALVVLLVALNLVSLVLQLAAMQKRADRYGRVVPAEPVPKRSARPYVWAIVGLAATKALAVGWQPNLAWWNVHEMGFSPAIAAVTFLLSGVGYAAGAARGAAIGRIPTQLAGIVGFALLELALRRAPWAWWPAVFLLGLWFGAYLTSAVVLLGWSDPSSLGRANAFWLAVTDLPMALTPAIVWTWRTPEPGVLRAGGGAALLAISTIAMLSFARRRGPPASGS